MLAAPEERGLVVWEGDPSDGRQSLLSITDAGRAVLRQDGERREAWLAEAMSRALTPAEQRLVAIVAELLDRLADE